MVWHVIPQSLDTGELGLPIEADTADAAAALAAAGPYAHLAQEAMIVRWGLCFDRQGELLLARHTVVRPKAPSVTAVLSPAPAAAAAPSEPSTPPMAAPGGRTAVA